MVEWEEDGRLLGLVARGFAVLAVTGIVATAVVAGGLSFGIVLLWLGMCLVGYVLTAVGLTASSALKAMREVGDEGDRLASSDVGLLPPQARRRRRRADR